MRPDNPHHTTSESESRNQPPVPLLSAMLRAPLLGAIPSSPYAWGANRAIQFARPVTPPNSPQDESLLNRRIQSEDPPEVSGMYYPRVSMYSSSAAAAAVRSSAPPPDGFVASAMKMARSALHKISGCDSEELIKACKSGNSHLVDKALEKHALQDNSALLAAVMRGHTNIVKLLAHKITVINANLIEALAEAAASGNNDMIILLLHDQVTAREYGLPALRQALANEHIDTIDLLINAGADPTSLGKECIEVAGKYKRVDVLQVLKEKDPAFGEHLGEALDSLLDINPLGPEEEDAISCLLGFQSG